MMGAMIEAPVKQRAYNRKYRQEHKAEKAAYDRKHYQEHKAEKAAYDRKHYQEHKAEIAVYWQKYYQEHKVEKSARYQKLKLEVLTYYGNGICACVQCGFTDIRALSIDHIKGDGAQWRKKTGKTSGLLYFWLKDNKFPEGYQTLCMNCQFIKSSQNNEYRRGV